jgi:hypothetical protein
MAGRLNRSLATVWQGIAVVSVLVWFWKMFPVISPHMGQPGQYWWIALVGLPPIAVMVWMDRSCALLLHRPGFWTRHR